MSRIPCKNDSRFTLIDDGPLDVIVQCDECGEELRFLNTPFYRDAEGHLVLEVIRGAAEHDRARRVGTHE